MDEKPLIIDYGRLPSPPSAPRSKKPLMVRLGWLFVFGPVVVALLVGVLVTMLNIIAPGATYQIGDATITPVAAEGAGMEWLRLFVAIVLLLLFSAMLRLGIRSARKYRD